MPVRFFRGLAVAAALAALALVGLKLALQPPVGRATALAAVLLLGFAALTGATARALRAGAGLGWLRAWALVVSVLFAYALVDAAAGLLWIGGGGPEIVADRALHHRLVPDHVTRVAHSDFTYTLRTNALGLRGPEVAVPKPAGTRRAVVLGDSFVMGEGVEREQTFEVLLEGLLASARPPLGHVEVVNAGVNSYAPVLSSLQLAELAPLEPDLVLHALDPGDLLQEQAYRKLAVRDARGRIERVDGTRTRLTVAPTAQGQRAPTHLLDGSLHWVRRHLFLTRLVLFSLREHSNEIDVENTVRLANPALLRHTLANDPVDPDERRAEWADLFESLQRTADEAQAQGAD